MGPDRRNRPITALRPAGVCLVVGLVSSVIGPGCGSRMGEIDRRVQQLVAERSATLGPDAAAPERSFATPEGKPTGTYASKVLRTENPPASALTFARADESRDVAARLAVYREKALGGAGGAETLTLAEAMRLGQQGASEYLSAEESYILAAISLLVERHSWGPRFFDDVATQIAGQGTDGNFQHVASIVNTLRVNKRLPYGGDVEARWVLSATEQLREQATGRYRQSSELIFSGNFPLLRGAGLVAQESLIQAERDLVYEARTFEEFRREFYVSISRDYFDLLQSASQIKNQESQLESVKRIETQQRAFFDAGRVAAFDVNTAANDLLQATASLASQYEGYILELERFKLRLGIDPQRAIVLDEESAKLPEPEVTLEEASALALRYRLDLQNRSDQLDDARRAVENAKNNMLPDLDATASVGIPTNPRSREGGLGFEPGDLSYSAGLTLGLPLDRQIERLGVRRATIALHATQREFDRFRDQVTIDVRQAVRNIDLSRFQLRLAEEAVKINERRLKEIELKSSEVDTQRQLDAANSLQQAKDSLDRARTSLRNAVLDYLRLSGQLRIGRDGMLKPLPGMEG